ncbi:TatA/E family twin arginine-targeting protein translocase [Nodosilinea sp. PGN35]|uniref:TatA/E family twin arginine-targeting protein translocase n=1 Tax=Nodosilinea sp. PGN35 TaxID=3020489 RepID=UPI0023B21C9F|nr:TatA/E family twin arginine-targeting protein translocase [Nodosilinea sp. TSF1-S3]MDF0366970.1 TatA/E family twin arginine-targeting protein translocase [Nodosilinea sp. TSF1-S3]
MNVFGVGLPEMALIMVLALLVFGPKKLPEIGRSMGKAIKGFQEASREFEEEFKKEAQQIEKAVTEPMKATLEPDAPKVLTPPEPVAGAGEVAAPLELDHADDSSPEAASEPAETDSPA